MLHCEHLHQQACRDALRSHPASRGQTAQRRQLQHRTQISAASKATPALDSELEQELALDLDEDTDTKGPSGSGKRLQAKPSWLSQQYDATDSLSQQYQANQLMDQVTAPCIP